MVPVPPVERESWGAIAGIVVLVLLVVLLLTLLLLYRRRQKAKHNNTPTVSFSTGRPATSEYAVPGRPGAGWGGGGDRVTCITAFWLTNC